MKNMDEETSIPPIAQTIMLRVIRFIINKASLILLLPIIIITNIVVMTQGTIFTGYMLFPLLLLIVFFIFYFRFRKKVLLSLEKYITNMRFNPDEYKNIKIRFQKENPEKNFEK